MGAEGKAAKGRLREPVCSRVFPSFPARSRAGRLGCGGRQGRSRPAEPKRLRLPEPQVRLNFDRGGCRPLAEKPGGIYSWSARAMQLYVHC